MITKLKFVINRTGFCLKSQCFSVQTIPAKNIKEFSDIPGPKGLFGVGTFYQYLPLIGKYSWDELHIAGFKKFLKYGPIVREKMFPGVFVVWIFNPVDIAVVLNDSNSKNYPRRRSHLALEKYRTDRPHIYKSAGLLPTNGEEWWRLRSELQKGLSSPKHVRGFLSDVDYITNEFIDQLESNKSINILLHLSRLNLEIICLLAFDERMNSFSKDEMHPNSRSSKLIEAAEISNGCILPTDQGLQLWRLFETPTYKKLKKSQKYIENMAVDMVSQKISYFRDPTHNNEEYCRISLLEEYLKNPNLDLSDIVGMVADILLAGVDTTTYSTSFALYHLANNPSVQDKLYLESKTVLSTIASTITEDVLKYKIPYARSVLKETLRINPISVGVGRISNTELVLSGFKIPKETVLVTQNMVACRLGQNFEDPFKFIPERWLNKTKINPYLSLPFGHGMRACIARRLAEQNILILLLRIVRRYKIELPEKYDMDVKTCLINKPDRPINITLIPRN